MTTSDRRVAVTSIAGLALGVGLLGLGRRLPLPVGILLTAGVTVGYATWVQAWLHRCLGHHSAGGVLHQVHVRQHHTIYSGSRVTSPEYLEEERSLTPLFLVPYGLSALVGYFSLPLSMWATFMGVFGACFWLQAWLHVEFHLDHPRLESLGWFRRLRDIHRIHHHRQGRNFGLVTLCWDRLFGTCEWPGPRVGIGGRK